MWPNEKFLHRVENRSYIMYPNGRIYEYNYDGLDLVDDLKIILEVREAYNRYRAFHRSEHPYLKPPTKG